jgi:hypothetical protein
MAKMTAPIVAAIADMSRHSINPAEGNQHRPVRHTTGLDSVNQRRIDFQSRVLNERAHTVDHLAERAISAA